MSKIFSWFNKKKPNSIISDSHIIKSLIIQKQIKEFTLYLRQKDTQSICIERFFYLLTSISDDVYTADLFRLIIKYSGLKSNQISTLITEKISLAIHEENFDLCEKILHLPFSSMKIPLPTYDITQLFHKCSNKEQLINCFSILIEKNLPYDSDYLLWILIILFEHYQIGDEILIEYILNTKKHINLLFKCYGNNNVTPLMLFLHLYSNTKCQILIDHYLSNINDQLILNQHDKWNRSYLTHLLCGQCQHKLEIDTLESFETKQQWISQCPNAVTILSKFSLFHKLGNQCETPTKTILTSQYCLPLRLCLLNYLIENDSLFKIKFDEFFQNFPSKFVPMYYNYLKQLVHNHNLNSTLESLIRNQSENDHTIGYSIKFLLRQGARINDMSTIHQIILNLIINSRSTIPFILLDYGMYINITSTMISTRLSARMNLYVCRVIQCGYPSEFRGKFEEFKSKLSHQTVQSIETFINLKKPTNLSKLCLQKLRNSLKDLGDERIDSLTKYLSKNLRLSITQYGYDECYSYFQSIVFSN